MTTSIEWTDETWNPVVGCRRVSPGCQHCYAERVAHRGMSPAHKGLTVMGSDGPRWTGEVRCLPERLAEPLRWRRKPRRVFVNSMSDLFHEDVPDEFIAAVFGVMAAAPLHTFQVLTKRPERMRDWFARLAEVSTDCSDAFSARETTHCVIAAQHATDLCSDRLVSAQPWPLPNVWLGVSCEDQQRADERVPLLLQCPAAVRFVSAEPLLGPIDFRAVPLPDGDTLGNALYAHGDGAGIDWIITGGESGPGARPCNVEWVRSIVKQCRDAGVERFVKQLGSRPVAFDPKHEWFDGRDFHTGGNALLKLRDRKGGDPSEWPEDLRVREWPGKAAA